MEISNNGTDILKESQPLQQIWPDDLSDLFGQRHSLDALKSFNENTRSPAAESVLPLMDILHDQGGSSSQEKIKGDNGSSSPTPYSLGEVIDRTLMGGAKKKNDSDKNLSPGNEDSFGEVLSRLFSSDNKNGDGEKSPSPESLRSFGEEFAKKNSNDKTSRRMPAAGEGIEGRPFGPFQKSASDKPLLPSLGEYLERMLFGNIQKQGDGHKSTSLPSSQSLRRTLLERAMPDYPGSELPYWMRNTILNQLVDKDKR